MTLRRVTGWTAMVGLMLIAACEQLPNQQPTNPAATGPRLSTHMSCQTTGTGLTAKVVNQDLEGGTIDVGDCDVGAYFSEDGEVTGTTFTQDDDEGAPGVQYAVLVDGSSVNISDVAIDVTPDFSRQFLGVAYRDGASGKISNSSITGFHRVGILARGVSTSVQVRDNDVIGVGPKTTAWAENGIQIDQGASATVAANRVHDHWWDNNDFNSSGILIFSNDVTVQRNDLKQNDLGIALIGDRNNVVHNSIDATDENATNVLHYGIYVAAGVDNGLRQNDLASGTASPAANYGILTGPSAENTKLIGNTVDGFTNDIVDLADETKLPKPFAP